MRQLILYTTSHCHLCEQAEALLYELSKQYELNWQAVEITTNDALIDSYGTRIPVLKNLDNNKELNWPFNQQLIASFIK